MAAAGTPNPVLSMKQCQGDNTERDQAAEEGAASVLWLPSSHTAAFVGLSNRLSQERATQSGSFHQ